ncbi:MAG: hypothetical protein V2A76_01420 [Planctomycetota bacterium]
MRLLIDSDAFCKLGASWLLGDAVAALGASLEECGRLAALPYMLRRGSLPRTYGAAVCEGLVPLAEKIAVVEAPFGPWLERLVPEPAIDPGEAILFATAAAQCLTIITGDTRALRTLKELEGFPDALSGRVVILEAILLSLCRRLGPEVVRERIEPVRQFDTLMRVCFSPGNRAPEEGLISYFRERQAELAPLALWVPEGEGR